MNPWKEIDDFREDLKDRVIFALGSDFLLKRDNFEIIAIKEKSNELLLEKECNELIKVSMPLSNSAINHSNLDIKYYSTKVDFWKKCLKNDIIKNKINR